MSDVVFVLGAGASREAGGPLMRDFIDTAESMLRSENCGHERPAFEVVFKAIAALQPVYAKAVLDTNNLESVFSAFEMAGLFGHLAPLAEAADQRAECSPNRVTHQDARKLSAASSRADTARQICSV